MEKPPLPALDPFMAIFLRAMQQAAINVSGILAQQIVDSSSETRMRMQAEAADRRYQSYRGIAER